MIYRLWTENKNKEKVFDIVGRFFDGFSVVYCHGFYKGIAEYSLCIEVDTSVGTAYDNIESRIENIVEEIKGINSQECVLVQMVHSHSRLL